MHKLLLIFYLQTTVLNSMSFFYGMATRNIAGSQQLENLLTPIQDQNQPKVCKNGSIVFAIASAISTAFNFKRGVDVQKTNVNLSAQMLMSCYTGGKFCSDSSLYNKGTVEKVLKGIVENGVSTFSCTGYNSTDSGECKDYSKCGGCQSNDERTMNFTCKPKDYHQYKLQSYMAITADTYEKVRDVMIEKLIQNGPLVCLLKHSDKLFSHRPKAFLESYSTNGNVFDIDTWVAVVGFIDGQWILQHSFGANIGYYGLITLKDTDDTAATFALKSSCYTYLIDPNVQIVINHKPKTFQHFTGIKKIDDMPFSPNPTLLLAPFVSSSDEGDVTRIDWRSKNGANWLTYMKSQSVPIGCGSCWVQAATSLLADQLKINYMSSLTMLNFT